VSSEKKLKDIFGRRLAELRKKRNLTQKEVADALRKVDIKQGQISQYENGTHFPGIETLLAIADYFDVNPAYLIDTENPVLREYREKQIELLRKENERLFITIKKTEETNNSNISVRDVLHEAVLMRDEAIAKLSMQS
jgi:transcriptional regulator with XRE-family HTH domain